MAATIKTNETDAYVHSRECALLVRPHGDKAIAIMNGGTVIMKSLNSISVPRAQAELTREEFDAKIARAIKQAAAGEGVPADEFFASLKREVLNSSAG